jgi:pilus assembly protein CpaB
LLALNPQDALLLKHLVDTGATFDIVLRSPNSTQLFELEPIISEYLIDKYQLDIKQ